MAVFLHAVFHVMCMWKKPGCVFGQPYLLVAAKKTEDTQSTYKVTLRRVTVTILAVETQ